jgi:hypothetical protein
MKLGEKTFAEVARQVGGLMKDNEGRLNMAYLKADEGLKVSFSTNIAPNGVGVNIKTEISFTVEKLKDTATGKVSEIQADLFAEHPLDKRHRLFCGWMVAGGEKAVGDKERWIKNAA